MRELLGGLVALVLVGAVMRTLEHFARARPPAPLVSRRRLVDLLHLFVGGPVGKALANVAVIATLVLALPTLLLHPLGWLRVGNLTPLARLPIAVQIPVALVVTDFFGYWAHRAMHARFWRFHAVHHSARELDWLSAVRNHPVGEALGRAMVALPTILVGVDPAVLATVVPVFAVWGLFLHANVRWSFGPLRHVIATPLFHRWHHSRAPEARGKNFAALFPLFDRLFGTLYLPDHQPDDFGVDDADGVPEGFFGQMVYPLRRALRPSDSS